MKTVFETIVDCRGKSDRFFWGMKLGRGDDRWLNYEGAAIVLLL